VTTAQALAAADLVAFYTHDDRGSAAVDPITVPDVECDTDEDTTYPPFGGTR
jgi:hypothetical protein